MYPAKTSKTWSHLFLTLDIVPCKTLLHAVLNVPKLIRLRATTVNCFAKTLSYLFATTLNDLPKLLAAEDTAVS